MENHERADGRGLGGRLDPETRRLATVFGLPLVDGVFVSLVLAGLIDTWLGVTVTGVLIFGGTATVAVILADCGRDPRADLSRLALIGAVAVPLAGVQALFAPTLAGLVDLVVLEWFAAAVLVVLAAGIARPAAGDWLPSPWVLIAAGFAASVRPAGGSLAFELSGRLLVHGAGAAVVGIAVAATVVLAGSRLRRVLEPGRLRIGAGLSLVVVAASLVTGIPTTAAVVVLVGGVAFAIKRDVGDRVDPIRAVPFTSPGD